MVKPAVLVRRDERPPPTSFTVTEAAQLTRRNLLRTRRDFTQFRQAGWDQAIDVSSEVMSIADGARQILFIPWAGRERATFGTEEGETGSYYEYTWAHCASPSGLLGILSED